MQAIVPHIVHFGVDMLAIETPARFELRKAIRRNTIRGLVVSVALHFLFLGVYFVNEWIASREEKAPTVQVRLMRYSELGPPPSIASSAAPSIAVAGPSVKPSIGIPVPVPDAEISPEQTIATQQELSQVQSLAASEGTGGEGFVVEQDITIDEPDINAFVAVEKLPIPIKQVKPMYPDIAQRSGMEGTVWVKILVDKEGNAKKAVIVKSDADIFDEPALRAALQWKFIPAIMNNGPVTVWVAIPFRFRLQDQPL